ncbi:glutathione S-transferase theta-2 [Chiloscyllium punctatum]|uniref:glutathione S-transferase theta-1-like n=1 Tax=Chiloscyllium plagiosum TaxID=36176 RepID=UPI001CB86183|nr:glutathione S-transferase theta-1-like [Chiloscyllium plagiosum]
MASRLPLRVYFDLLSQPSRAVLIFLRRTGIPHVEKPVALRKGEQRSPEFTKLNPNQKVPVIVDNGFVLTESVAILKYLATKYDIPQFWYPVDSMQRAKVDEYMAWQHATVRYHASKVFILEVLIPRMTGQPLDETKLNKALAELNGTLDILESMFLKDQAFLCGDEMTLADLLAICELMQPLGANRDILKDRPKLIAWRNRVQSALGKTFDDVHSFLYQLRDKARL